MWNTLPLELALEEALQSAPIRGFGESEGSEYLGFYFTARRKLEQQILPYICREEPDLSLHDASHVANVMNNAHSLLGDQIGKLSGVELYCLAVSILFHDVGNLYGRDGHRDKLDEIYWDVRDNNQDFSQEKTVIAKIIRAHTGPARDGGFDTLKDIMSDEQLFGRKVSVLSIAAILRLADELAEGPQRTSAYILNRHGFRQTSEIYHQYARSTQICIDSEGGRIILTYNIILKSTEGKVREADEDTVKQMLNFILKRVLKLDQERRYNKHYCDLLQRFKTCRVQINFHLGAAELDLGMEPLLLSDKIVPGQLENAIQEKNPAYDPDRLWQHLSSITVSEAMRQFPSS